MMAPNEVLMSFSAHLAHVQTLAASIDPSLTVEENGETSLTVCQNGEVVASIALNADGVPWQDDAAISAYIRRGMIELAEFNARFVNGPSVDDLIAIAADIHPHLKVQTLYGEPDDELTVSIRSGIINISLATWDVRKGKVQVTDAKARLQEIVDDCLDSMTVILARRKI